MTEIGNKILNNLNKTNYVANGSECHLNDNFDEHWMFSSWEEFHRDLCSSLCE